MRFFRLTTAIAAAFAISGCCTTGQTSKVEPIGSMSTVLKGVRTSLVELKKTSDEKVGLGVNKITATFKVTGVEAKSGELELGITKPVGTVGFSASRETTTENAIVIEFTPAGPKYEKCPASSKDSIGRACTPTQIVELPDSDSGPVLMRVLPGSGIKQ